MTTRGRPAQQRVVRPARLIAFVRLRSVDTPTPRLLRCPEPVSTLTHRVLTRWEIGLGATTTPPTRPPGPSHAGDPSGRHRGIRHDRHAGRQPGARRALSPRRVQRDRAQHPGRARSERPADPPAHLRRPHPDGLRLPLLRRVDRRGRSAARRRAADDPPPVRPGRVRQRALVPPRRDDPRLGHAFRRSRHAGQAARRAHPPDRPGRHQRADGQPDPRPARGRDQAGADHGRRRRCHRPAHAQRGRGTAQRAPRRHDREPRRGAHRRASTPTTGSTPSPGGSGSASSRSSASTTPRRSRRSSATACSM